MSILARIAGHWRNVPLAVVAAAALLLLAGIGVILQNEAAYRDQQEREVRVQADILAASVTAALDFGDAPAAQEAVDALRVNRQVRVAGIYDAEGRLVAGFARDAAHLAPTSVEATRAAGGAIAALIPVTTGGEPIGSVFLAADPEPISRRITRYLVIGLLVLLATLVVAVLGIAQTALRSANRQLAERAQALSAANAELKVQVGERVKAEEELRQAQKMQALGQLTGGIAHDFNNLLTVIQGSADMLLRPAIDERKRVRFAEAIVQAAGRAAALTSQLLAFARRQPLRPELLDVNALIGGMTDLLDRTLGERIRVETILTSEHCAVEVDRAQLEAALLNIAVNARDAMADGGTLTIRTNFEQYGGKTAMALSVRDTGSGIDQATLERVFEPFFTTKSAGKGTGLGLSQVYGFARQSGGDVRIESTIGKGTCITILLPCSSRTPTQGEGEQERMPGGRRSGHILLVEDNEEVGAFAQALLEEIGIEVTRAVSGSEALALVGERRFDLVFTDVVMPGMSGLELADRLAELFPDLPVVLTTGYSDEIAESGAGGRPVILKPYRYESLMAVLDDVLKER